MLAVSLRTGSCGWGPSSCREGGSAPPPSLAQLDGIDGGAVLARLWEERAVDDGDEESAEWIDDMIEPFSRDFPGLAAPGEEQRPAPELAAVLDALPPLHLCLAAADRPAG